MCRAWATGLRLRTHTGQHARAQNMCGCSFRFGVLTATEGSPDNGRAQANVQHGPRRALLATAAAALRFMAQQSSQGRQTLASYTAGASIHYDSNRAMKRWLTAECYSVCHAPMTGTQTQGGMLRAGSQHRTTTNRCRHSTQRHSTRCLVIVRVGGHARASHVWPLWPRAALPTHTPLPVHLERRGHSHSHSHSKSSTLR